MKILAPADNALFMRYWRPSVRTARLTVAIIVIAPTLGPGGSVTKYQFEVKEPTVPLRPRDERWRSQLERRMHMHSVPTPPLRPLGSKFMVDKEGIIWDQGHPVGVWDIGINDMRPAPSSGGRF